MMTDEESEETLFLIAQLILEDVESINNARKGKAREDVPPSDAEIAFQLQAEFCRGFRQACDDHRFADSLDRAIDTDQRVVQALDLLEIAASDDRFAASAVERHQPLPVATAAQRALERLNFEERQHDRDGVGSPDSSSSTPTTIVISADLVADSSPPKEATEECIVCGDRLARSVSICAPCHHSYCAECFIDLAKASIKDESLHPLRCCNQRFVDHDIMDILPADVRLAFSAKAREFGTPANERIYCPNGLCSEFLGNVNSHGGADFACTACCMMICVQCKQASHQGESCAENNEAAQVRALAQTEHWQTCPGCGSIIELAFGCYHITCRCRRQFCYLCAAPWKQCQCPQWDEARLVHAAEQVVQNQFGARARYDDPALFRRRVATQRENLRVNHDCNPHSWRYRHGGGRCQECYFDLPQYLLTCTQCRLLACVRCSRNRL